MTRVVGSEIRLLQRANEEPGEISTASVVLLLLGVAVSWTGSSGSGIASPPRPAPGAAPRCPSGPRPRWRRPPSRPLEEHERRHAPDASLGRDVFRAIDVNLEEANVAVLQRHLREVRRDALARAAPGRREVDDGDSARRLGVGNRGVERRRVRRLLDRAFLAGAGLGPNLRFIQALMIRVMRNMINRRVVGLMDCHLSTNGAARSARGAMRESMSARQSR